MTMIAVFVILAFQFFEIIDSQTVVIYRGEVGTVNCTSEQYSGKINIDSVDINNTQCNTSRREVESRISFQCQNLTECLVNLTDVIPCYENETTDDFVEILYRCAVDGGWSDWNEYSTCSLTCGGGVKSKHRTCDKPVPNSYGRNCSGFDVEEMACNTQNCSNPYYMSFIEGEVALLTCSEEFNETIILSSILYYQGNCSHKDLYGIQNLCDRKTMCSFEVSNSKIGSSCGNDGQASLELSYSCKRNGGWSDWGEFGSCSVTCGQGLQTRFRKCVNPTPNELGNACVGENITQQICSKSNCIYGSSACINETVTWTCESGFIEVNDATWATSIDQQCQPASGFQKIDVTGQMQLTCSNKTNCLFPVEDATFNRSCQEPGKTCSIFKYIYSCHEAQWEAWTEWGECSRSCGVGFQSRTRNCPVHRNSTDGYAIACVGNSSNSRICNINVCPCAPPIFQPNITNAEIPDHTAVDSWIISLPIIEPDYVNYWQYLQFDYENKYLYIDTRLRSLHVKKPFPHIKGQHNTTHTYILTIVDACNNTVVSSISVLSYNAPPVITGLKDIIHIDPSVLGNSSFLTGFQVIDQSGDNVSCVIEETTPATATVSLNISGNDMGLHLTGNASFTIATFSEMSVLIACTDGTNIVKIRPIIRFISGEQWKSNGTNAAIIAIAIIVPVLFITGAVALWYYMKRRRMLMSVKKLSDYVVTHKLSSDDEDDLGEINPASQHKDENEHAYTSLPKADENKSSNSASFKLAATKGEYVDAWR